MFNCSSSISIIREWSEGGNEERREIERERDIERGKAEDIKERKNIRIFQLYQIWFTENLSACTFLQY